MRVKQGKLFSAGLVDAMFVVYYFKFNCDKGSMMNKLEVLKWEFHGTMPSCPIIFDKYFVSQALGLFKFCASSCQVGGELVTWLPKFLVQV
ncbi:MAG: hypothetical protein ABL869_14225 [Candidatus Nitrotoga sp.]